MPAEPTAPAEQKKRKKGLLLTEVEIRKAQPEAKAYRMSDTGGLHLFVAPKGTKHWRMRYEYGGKEGLLSFGPYPQVTLTEAREARDEARAILRSGRDPSAERKRAKQQIVADYTNTFEVVAREWHEQSKAIWSVTHASDVMRSFERDVFPVLGKWPLKRIEVPDVLDLLRRVEKREAKETARRIRQRMSAVFVFGIATSRCAADPAAVVKNAMAPLSKGRQPALTSLDQAQQILRDVDATPGLIVTKLALRILALTAVRPGTLTTTPWSEFDELDPEEPVWRIPAARMKMRLAAKTDDARDHLVPLSREAFDAIDTLREITGASRFVFPNSRHRHRPMSENAVGYLLNRAGYHHRHVPHGWRATFSTIMNERYPADRSVIDVMLAHVPKDRVEAAYNRALYLSRRRELAQAWADLLMVDQRPAGELAALPRRIGRSAAS